MSSGQGVLGHPCGQLRLGIYVVKNVSAQGFPGGSVVKTLSPNAGDMGLIPDLGRPHMPQSN